MRGSDLTNLQSLCKNRHTYGPFAKTKRFFDRFDSFGDRFGQVVQGMQVVDPPKFSVLLEKIRLIKVVLIDTESAVQASFAAGVYRGVGG